MSLAITPDPTTLVAQATTSPSWVDTPVLRSVPQSDAAQLTNLLSAQTSTALAPVSSTSSAANTMGDQILKGMQSIGKSYADRMSAVQTTMATSSAENLNPGTVLSMVLNVTEAGLLADATSKVTSEITKIINDTTKVQ